MIRVPNCINAPHLAASRALNEVHLHHRPPLLPDLKVFANAEAAATWFAENDPEGVAFEYEVLEMKEAAN
jgi:hypothetical protein